MDQLSRGISMPMKGLGTFRISEKQVEDIVYEALNIGYRHIDTATVYKNERGIGRALKRWISQDPGNKREEVFITSKLGPKEHAEKAADAALASLNRLGLEYLDCLLIHWPGTQGKKLDASLNYENRKATWAVLERLFMDRKVKQIGVSNYELSHLCEMESYARILPQNLQIEIHPLYIKHDIIDYCRKNKISITAYSLFGEGKFLNGSLTFEPLQRLSQKYGISISQILLQWALQHDFHVIPKTCSKTRLLENFTWKSIELNQEEMNEIDSLNCGKKFCWDPKKVL